MYTCNVRKWRVRFGSGRHGEGNTGEAAFGRFFESLRDWETPGPWVCFKSFAGRSQTEVCVRSDTPPSAAEAADFGKFAARLEAVP
jgi:hypothetical protein